MKPNNMLVNDIKEKVLSEDYNYNGFGYHDYGYHLNGFCNNGAKFQVWTLETEGNKTVMEINFLNKEVKYNSKDTNASDIARVLEINGWKI